jgi:hypothetical protein
MPTVLERFVDAMIGPRSSQVQKARVADPSDLGGFLESTIKLGGPNAFHATIVKDFMEKQQYDQSAFGQMINMSRSATVLSSSGGMVGINDYGVKGRRQYAAERRRLLDLYTIVLNNGDIRTAVTHLRNEIFRRGLEWEPAFEYKCDLCDETYTEKEAKRMKKRCACPEFEEYAEKHELQGDDAEGYPLRRPDKNEIKKFDKFLDRANYFDQSFESILRMGEDDINVVDDAFIYLRKHYWTDEEIMSRAEEDPFDDASEPRSEVLQIFRLDPTLIEFDMDSRGIPGQAHHVCVVHRDELLTVPYGEGWDAKWRGVCPDCGLQTYPVYYKYSEQQSGTMGASRPIVLYLTRDEVIHWSRYTPCYDFKTEVMTRNGWKRIVDVDVNADEVATRSEDGFLEWQRPLDKVVRPYTGPMWVAKTQRVDLVVTPHHRLWVRGAYAEEPGYTPVHAHDEFPSHHVATKHRELGERNSGYEAPVREKLTTAFGLVEAYRVDNTQRIYMSNTARWSGTDIDEFEIPGYAGPSPRAKYFGDRAIASKTVKMSDWLEFLGYFLTGGSYAKSSSPSRLVEITQSRTANPETRAAIMSCVERLGLRYSSPGDKIHVWHPGLRRYLEQFGRSRDRFIPDDVKQLPVRRLAVLFDAIMRGDGHFDEQGRPTLFKSISPRFRDDVAEIAIKLGYQVAFLGDAALRFGVNREADLCLNSGTYGMSQEDQSVGAVFGLEVPNHVMMVRRNGKTVWSGNTETYGFSPVLSIYEKALTLIGMDRYLYDYFYERKIPQGAVAVTTDDIESFNSTKQDVEAHMQQDPHYIPWVAIASKTGQGRMEFVRFAYSLDELDYLPVRDEIRERISGLYGVSQLWMSSTDGIGGLNSESQQLTVMSRVVEGAQRSYHVDVFPKLETALHVHDWHLRIKTPEESNELITLQIRQTKAAIAQSMAGMGFGVEYDSEEDEFIFSGRVLSMEEQQKQQMAQASPFDPGGGGQPPNAPGAQPSAQAAPMAAANGNAGRGYGAMGGGFGAQQNARGTGMVPTAGRPAMRTAMQQVRDRGQRPT